jgi:hypothetical protein
LMTVPPYVVACFCCITAGWPADRLKTHGHFMIEFFVTAVIGLIMLISSDNNHVKYAGCFFFASGIYPNVPQGVAWNGNNIGGSLKRGVGIAMHVGFGNLGGAILIHRSEIPQDSPCFINRKRLHRKVWCVDRYLDQETALLMRAVSHGNTI